MERSGFQKGRAGWDWWGAWELRQGRDDGMQDSTWWLERGQMPPRWGAQHEGDGGEQRAQAYTTPMHGSPASSCSCAAGSGGQLTRSG